MNIKNKIRKGLKDIWWNAYMTEGAAYEKFDIPSCPTILTSLPTEILTWEEAKARVRAEKRKGKVDFKFDAFVCFYCDDYKFDSSAGIWFRARSYYERYLKYFRGIITPDFSTYIDFPYPLKIWNTYRMRAFGYWAGKQGLEVINNLRGDLTTLDFSNLGIPKHSVIAIGTVGSGINRLENRPQFEQWLFAAVEDVKPEVIITYGSANYKCFDELKKKGIEIVSFPSKTDKDFRNRRNKDE